jgi:hypothetical protein
MMISISASVHLKGSDENELVNVLSLTVQIHVQLENYKSD